LRNIACIAIQHLLFTYDKNLVVPVKFVVVTKGAAQSAAGSYTPAIKNICNGTIIGSPTTEANVGYTNYHRSAIDVYEEILM